jgi:hypothetical protein
MEDKKPEISVVPAVPEYMKKYAPQNQQDAASMAMSSISVPRLSYRGKRFRFILNSEEELVPTLTVKVILLGVEPDAGKFLKTFYEKGYQPGDSDPPTCSSSDGIVPDEWVTAKQSPTCAHCPKNVFGSATSMKGGKAKACKDGKRLWVAKDPATFPGSDPNLFYGLNVPVMSLKNLSEYGKYIGRNNYPLALVVTEIGMDEDEAYPRLIFKHAGFVDEKVAEVVMKINAERPWRSTFANAQMLPDAYEPAKQIPAPQTQIGAAPSSNTTVDEVVGKW